MKFSVALIVVCVYAVRTEGKRPECAFVSGFNENNETLPGETIILLCKTTSVQQSTLTWTENGIDTLETGKVVLQYERVIQIDDVGISFNCKETSGATSTTCETSIRPIILFPPRSVSLAISSDVNVGDVATLTCKTSRSNPASMISWYKDNINIYYTDQSIKIGEPNHEGNQYEGYTTTQQILITTKEEDKLATFHCSAEALGFPKTVYSDHKTIDFFVSTPHFASTANSTIGPIVNATLPTSSDLVENEHSTEATITSTKGYADKGYYTLLMVIVLVVTSVVVTILGIIIVCLLCRNCKERKTTVRSSMTNSSEDYEEIPMAVLAARKNIEVNKEANGDHDYENLPMVQGYTRRSPNMARHSDYTKIGTRLYEMSHDDIEINDLISRGKFYSIMNGYVRVVDGSENITKAALKIFLGSKETKIFTKRNFIKEIEVLKKVSSLPNIINFLGCCTKSEPLCIILEYASHDNLKTYLTCHRETLVTESIDLSQEQMLAFASHISSGMAHLTKLKIVHRYLAAEHVLVTEQKICKISNFSYASGVISNSAFFEIHKNNIPYQWMAVESLTKKHFTMYSDVWSFGVVLWEMFSLGKDPYSDISADDIVVRLNNGFRLQKPIYCGTELYVVMYSCWRQAIRNRPSFSELTETFRELSENE
ncbi:fibroblast growth factor receptor-like [Ptychodera flava]|uniref:fibroblast growth factor receptor-like n=1 Tax=Ptychodera flava TaxID=63121 RepID=UPI00396A3CE6